ncbi:MAG: hypothetical protein J5522_03730 [Lachnospiraceae bacterium]|nr:hypothetical protein [Lachnospiraceae bacterium]
MEILFDALFDLLLTGGECAVRSNKVPKPIRIFLAIIGLLFYLAVIGLITFAGITIIIDQSVLGGSILVAVALLMIVLAIRKVILIRSGM